MNGEGWRRCEWKQHCNSRRLSQEGHLVLKLISFSSLRFLPPNVDHNIPRGDRFLVFLLPFVLLRNGSTFMRFFFGACFSEIAFIYFTSTLFSKWRNISLCFRQMWWIKSLYDKSLPVTIGVINYYYRKNRNKDFLWFATCLCKWVGDSVRLCTLLITRREMWLM